MVTLVTWLWQGVVNNWPQGRPWSPTHIHTMLCNALRIFLRRLFLIFPVQLTYTRCFGNILGKTFVFSDISNSSNIHAMLCNALETFLGRLLSFFISSSSHKHAMLCILQCIGNIFEKTFIFS